MPKFKPGDLVIERAAAGRQGVVRALGPVHAGEQFYEVFFGGAAGLRTVGESDLRTAEVPDDPFTRLLEGHFDDYDAFLRVMLINRLKRDQALRNNIYAFNASRTKLFPYQFRPLIKLLDSERQRLLICDEVGLGKTIEAGLILTELKARQDLNHILVVCPSSLRIKWQDELKLRFDEEFQLISRRGFVEWLDKCLESPTPPRLTGILSIDALGAEAVVEKLERMPAPIDLLIVDEAHYVRNPGTHRSKGVRQLAQSSSAVLFLTATPIHLGRENLYTLLSILDPSEFSDLAAAEERFLENENVVRAQSAVGAIPPRVDDAIQLIEPLALSPWFAKNPFLEVALERLRTASRVSATEGISPAMQADLQRLVAQLNLIGHIYTRARRREVHVSPPVRDAVAKIIAPTKAERTFYDTATLALRDVARRRANASEAFTLQMPQRQMASSIHAMARAYRERGLSSPTQGDESDAGAPSERTWEYAGQTVQELLGSWPADAPDSKYDTLRDILKGIEDATPGSKVVLFAFFKATLAYLRDRLTADGFGVALIDGDQDPAVRMSTINRFREEPRCRVLLASKVGTEGLDLQFANTLVNYDLPWNPMEVEQRIGRIDRLGQEAKRIHIFSLWVEGTIEERILRRLYERLRVFEESIGDLEAILGEVVGDLEEKAFSGNLSEAELARAAEQAVLRIEHDQQASRLLEDESQRFLGVEHYFDQEVGRIQSRRRYVTPQQLQRFVERFLEGHAPNSRLVPDKQDGVHVVIPDQRLRDHLQRHTRAEAAGIIGAGPDGHRLTFDGELALRYPRLDLVNVQHPLVRSITAHYLSAPEAQRGAFLLSLRTRSVAPGAYLFRVFRVSLGGVRQHHLLEVVFLHESGAALTGEEAEGLLGELVELGGTWGSGDPDLNEGDLRDALGVAEMTFLARWKELRAEEERVNGALLERRLASLDNDHNRERERLQELLGRKLESRIHRMYEGRLRNLATAHAARRREIETRREVTSDYVEVAAGLVRVEA